jgi:hypothetical protein
MFSLYQRLLRLRRDEPVLVSGKLSDMSVTDGVLQFLRSDDNTQMRICVNLAEERREVTVEDGLVVACTDLHRQDEPLTGMVRLGPAQGLVIKVAQSS